MSQKKSSISSENSNIQNFQEPKEASSAGVFLVNVNQLHLTPHDLKGYEDIYPGAAKDVLNLINKTLDNQLKSEKWVQMTNKEILDNEKLKLGHFKHKLYLSFFLSVITLLVGCYLIQHPSPWLSVLGVALILGVSVSAFEIQVLSVLKNIFKVMFKWRK